MAQSLDADIGQPVHLLYGVTTSEDLCKLDELDALTQRIPGLKSQIIVSRPAADWDGPVGLVTDLLDERMLDGGDADVYLCGPAAMVEATRSWLDNNGIHRIGLYYEKFVPSGAMRRTHPGRAWTTRSSTWRMCDDAAAAPPLSSAAASRGSPRPRC